MNISCWSIRYMMYVMKSCCCCIPELNTVFLRDLFKSEEHNSCLNWGLFFICAFTKLLYARWLAFLTYWNVCASSSRTKLLLLKRNCRISNRSLGKWKRRRNVQQRKVENWKKRQSSRKKLRKTRKLDTFLILFLEIFIFSSWRIVQPLPSPWFLWSCLLGCALSCCEQIKTTRKRAIPSPGEN